MYVCYCVTTFFGWPRRSFIFKAYRVDKMVPTRSESIWLVPGTWVED